MRISLGQHIAINGQQVQAWIEPNRPILRAGLIQDDGFLCISFPDDSESGGHTEQQFESMCEDLHRLSEAVGHELGRKLWNERLNYDNQPFFMAYDHAVVGRLYAECVEPGQAVRIATRLDSRYPNDKAMLETSTTSLQLPMLFAHEFLVSSHARLPEATQLDAAAIHAEKISAQLRAAHSAYAALVDWDFDQRLTTIMLGATGRLPLTDAADVERFDRLSQRAIRPGAAANLSAAESLRWLTPDGMPRMEPLTITQLTQALHQQQALAMPEAQQQSEDLAISAADWAWFCEKRLGRMEHPMRVLHELISIESQSDSPDAAWLTRARHAGDFCTSMPASPQKIHAVIDEMASSDKLSSAQRERVDSALQFMRDPASGLVVDNGLPTEQQHSDLPEP